MRVIFLNDVPGAGKKYDIKEVSDGYATNFLLPRKLAVFATGKAIAELEIRKKKILLEREMQTDLLLQNLKEIKGKSITIRAQVSEKGHLFSAIHKKEIIDAMREQHGASIGEEFIDLEKPIKEIGEHEIKISIGDKRSSFKLIVKKI